MADRTRLSHIAQGLAREIANTVYPYLGLRLIDSNQRDHTDITFQLDSIAQSVIEPYLSERLKDYAVFSEHQGLVVQGEPRWVFVIDPIDGTRGAKSNFEACLVSIAVAKFQRGLVPALHDVEIGVLQELKGNGLLTAVKGKGFHYFEGGKLKRCSTSGIEKLDEMALSIELIGRPSSVIAQLAAPLVNVCGLKGGVFVFCSSSYSLSRIVTGQLDTYIDLGGRVINELPQSLPEARKAALGEPMGMYAYDIAAAYILAQEAGVTVTDAEGNSLDSVSLFGVRSENILSCIAAATPTLHQCVLQVINRQFETVTSAHD